MAAPTYNTTLYRGITFTRTVTLKTDATTAFDLSGCSVASKLRTSANSRQLTASFTCTLDDDPTTGRFVMELSAADTAKIDAGQYNFDIILTLPSDGKNKLIAQGTIVVLNTCTR
jgi:hypothetical protein